MSRRPGPCRTAAGLVTLAVTVLVTATGCASIPSSSRPQVIAESVPASSPADDDVRYDEIVPRPGEAPEDIVRDFLRASGSFERSHARARAYLTDAANAGWKDVLGATILEDAPYLNPGEGGSTVTMTAQRRGRLDGDGSYEPDTSSYRITFRLKKINGNWRIENPPSGLLIEAGTFEAAYDSYDVYFLDATRTRVVPDVRWYAAAPDSVPTQLVTALEQGPSRALDEAVLSDFDGISLQNNIEPGGDRVKVFLTGLDERAETLTTGAFAQLIWTLHQIGVGGVEVYSDGRLLAPRDAPGRTLQQFGDWRAFNPDGLTATATSYFIQGGAVRTTQGTPFPGPAGRTSFGAESVGMSHDQLSLAVVRRAAGGRRVLYVGSPTSLHATVTGSTLTRPTWGLGTREVWTVRDGRDVLIVPLTGQAVRVDVQRLDQLDTIRALTLSRDGARVAIVAGPAGQEQLWIGVVSQEGGTTRIDGLRTLEAGDNPVSDVSWSDALNVVALTRSGGDSSLYSVDIGAVSATGARLISTAKLPGPPTAIAAAPSLPLLTVAAGGLWRMVSPDDPWTRVAADTRSGVSAPGYPG
ncbi:MAG TPA: LpqB family beta-propeller domain-containing protein [Mycobacteriales bacterium]|nr:LpqB family beta-propeller domain-containing protein [Mycobacteriales bacterium]